MAKADSFMKKFSLRRLKMGTIIEFLTKLGMTDSRAKFVQTLKTLQVSDYSKYQNSKFNTRIEICFILIYFELVWLSKIIKYNYDGSFLFY